MTRSLSPAAGGVAARIIRTNHAGEFGAVNLYRAQMQVARLTAPSLLPQLQACLDQEWRHMEEFRRYMVRRGISRSASHGLFGVGGYVLGVLIALLGGGAINACTAALDTAVTRHLENHAEELRAVGDIEALQAVQAVIVDDTERLRVSDAKGRGSLFFWPIRGVVSGATAIAVWLGMSL